MNADGSFSTTSYWSHVEFLGGYLLQHPTCSDTVVDRKGTRWTYNEVEEREGLGVAYFESKAEVYLSQGMPEELVIKLGLA